jgi:hypothetical protein
MTLLRMPRAFRERKLCEAPPLVNQDVESVVVNARLCGAEVLQEIKIRPAVWADVYRSRLAAPDADTRIAPGKSRFYETVTEVNSNLFFLS